MNDDYYKINKEFLDKLSNLEVSLEELYNEKIDINGKIKNYIFVYDDIRIFITKNMTPYLEKNEEQIYLIVDKLKKLHTSIQSKEPMKINVKPLKDAIVKIKRSIYLDISSNEKVNKKIYDSKIIIAIIGLIGVIFTALISNWDKIRDKTLENEQTQVGLPTVSTIPRQNCKPKDTERFKVNECCSITDKKTGLDWFVGENKNYTWNQAYTWAGSLSACQGGWGLPTDDEVNAIYDTKKEAGIGYLKRSKIYPDGRYFKAHLDPVFYKIGNGSWIWLANQPIHGHAKAFNLNQGFVVDYNTDDPIYTTRVFAVRKSEF